MGKRLSKLYTRTGDDGSTGLGDGSRVAKHAPRVQAYGCVDELNAAIGVAVAALPADSDFAEELREIQHALFDLGGELSIPGMSLISQDDVSELEARIDAHNADLPALTDFILPGGDMGAAQLQLARTICRRAERDVLALHKQEDVNEPVVAYLNRLSDLLFVLGRKQARLSGQGEQLWSKARRERARGQSNSA